MAIFKRDTSISFIDIREQELHELFRSKSSTVPATGNHKHRCEAFICSAKAAKGFRIHVALLDSVSRETLVYSPPEQPADLSDYDSLKEDALSFLSAMGFSMEQINIKFSSAMRQVIIRDIRVMHPPAPKGPSIRGIAQKNQKVIETEPAAEIEVDIAVPAHETAAADKILKASLPEKTRHEAPAGPEEKLIILPITEAAEAAPHADDAEIARLGSELEKAAAEKQALEESVKALEMELEEVRKSHETREGKLEEQLANARVRLSEYKEENREALAASAAGISSLKEEIARLGAEKDAFAAAVAGKFREAKAAFDRVVAAREAAVEEMTEIRERYEVLLSERAAVTAMAGPVPEAPLAAPVGEVVQEEPQAVAEAEYHPETSPVQEVEPEKEEELAAETDPFAFMKETGFDSVSLTAALTGPLTSFIPAPDLDFVEIASTEEVRELYQSINVVEFNPGGNRPQKCHAYICAVGEAPAPTVYLCWRLLKENRNLIYVPEEQPTEPESFAKAMKDAVYYFESIGFMIDRVTIPDDPKKREKAIEKVPVVHVRRQNMAA